MVATVLDFPKEQARVEPKPAEQARVRYDLYQPEGAGYVGIDLLIPGARLLAFLEVLGPFLQGE